MSQEGPADSLELTILMPCLDEAATVGRCVEKAKGVSGPRRRRRRSAGGR